MRINITGVNLVEFTKKVYELSVPQGLGFMHFTNDPLNQREIEDIVDMFRDNKRIALSLDYIKGRACKMVVFREGTELSISPVWYDHTEEQLKQLFGYF